LLEDAKDISKKAKVNARKKQWFHRLGQGGYKTAIPKWGKKEEDLMGRGIVPVTFNRPE
jgi:hypothetical protein